MVKEETLEFFSQVEVIVGWQVLSHCSRKQKGRRSG
jgi:hypothetical protein